MRVVGVVDLLHERAVHARAGPRQSYVPVRMVAGSAIDPGDPISLARGYLERLGIAELYAADLDAILGGAPQDATLGALIAVGAPLWLDAAVRSDEQARHALALGAARVVVGLETLPSFDALAGICAAVGGDRVAFSLDLRDGQPVVAPDALAESSHAGGIGAGEAADRIAARAVDAGVGTVIVLDLARVGTGRGLDLDLVGRVRAAVPGLRLLAGGGVRDAADLVHLADAGCDGALVATALQDGRLGAADVAAARHLRPGRPLRSPH